MRGFCSRIAERFGDWWTWLGWGLFGAWALGAAMVLTTMEGASAAAVLTVAIICLVLVLGFFAWWLIDAVDQEVAWWVVSVGVVMLVAGCAPVIYAKLLPVAAFVIYMLRVRE